MFLISMLHLKRIQAKTDYMVVTILLTILTLGQIALTEQNNKFNLQSTYEEEITLEANHDYDRAEHSSSQANHNSATKHSEQSQSPAVQALLNNDPFAVTFEDYLRDASSESSDQHRASHISDSSVVSPMPSRADLMIEEEENLVKPKEAPSTIDYIFPPSKQGTHHHNANTKQATEKTGDETANNKNASDLLNEIRLLFAWKQLPTNKCSKTCGKGMRVNHLSCIDLKYEVRVEDELCLRSNLPKPSDLSEEPCNEIDCPPQWLSVGFKECNEAAPHDGNCRSSSYKRAQCTMINQSGALLYLDDSKCNGTQVNPSEGNQDSVKSEYQLVEMRKGTNQAVEDENIDIGLDDTYSNNEKNSIIDTISPHGESEFESLLHDGSSIRGYSHNEPFFDVGPWSECSGAPCGQLGKRTRALKCRLYLSRSSRFTDLPESSCQSAQTPDTQEPCYIDCAPESGTPAKKTSGIRLDGQESNEETVYDLEMARFIWKRGGWTKCTAECLGGRRESIIECWDKVTETVTEPSLCDLESKLPVQIETCNEIPCQPEWKVGPYTACTKPCGSSGFKTRSVSCIQQVPLQGGSASMVVSNDLCIQSNSTAPHNLEPCNRFDCKPEWSVGPWSECSKRCGEGVKNRTVICVQEFAHKEGPRKDTSHRNPYKPPGSGLLEAIAMESNWHPGKAIQIPFQECYEEYKTVPSVEERCINVCEKEPYIDADANQNYRMSQEAMKRKTVTLRVGGKAQIFEGRNLKIRCRLMNTRQSGDNLVKKVHEQVEWRKDGVKIFSNGTTIADKQYVPDDTNSIIGNDIFNDEKNQFLADEPKSKRAVRLAKSNTRSNHNLNTRAWDYRISQLNSQVNNNNFNFVPQLGGRFSLVKESTLRIKRLRADDSGIYTCSHGQLRESLDLKVLSRRDPMENEEKLANNLRLHNLDYSA